jgi:predicted permease
MNRKKEERLDEELRHHLEAEARDRRADGLPPDAARSAALRDLGNIARIKEDAREVWGWTSLQRLEQDLRYGLRMLQRSPGLTTLAVVSLAVGIGANTTAYTIVRAVLSAPTGVPDEARVVNLHGLQSGGSRLISVNYPDWLTFRDANTAFAGMCAWSEAEIALNAGDATQASHALLVTGAFFETFNLRPAAGRFFSPGDETSPVVVVGHRFWRAHPETLGATVRINGRVFSVIGVAPAGFTSPYPIFAPDLYLPLQHKEMMSPGIRFDNPGAEYLKMTGRLRPGLTRAQAEASLRLLPFVGQDKPPRKFALSGLTDFPDDIRLPMLGAAAFLYAIAGFVLVIACANVGSLLLARATARRAEIGVRLALGAGRGRIVRQLVTESVLLFLPAAVGGFGLCLVAVSALDRIQASLHLPIQVTLAVDYRVLLFTLALALAAGVLFGLAPAAQSLRMAVLPFLKDTAIAGPSRLRNAFLICEFSLAFILVMALGMFVDAARRVGMVSPGKDPGSLYLVDIDMRTLGYPDARRAEVFRRIFEQAQAVPGIENAAYAAVVPIGWEYSRSHLETLDGRPFNADSNRISPGYLRTAGIALIRGRDFSSADRGGAVTAVIVNETMARSFWPGEDPIGKRFGRPARILQVIGVAADTRQNIWAGPTPLFVYFPVTAEVPSSLTLHLRTRGDVSSMLSAVRDIVRAVDPNIPIQAASSLEARIGIMMLPHRIAAALAGAFGALGALLAALGIYGVTAYAVAHRTREIGLRMAMGADPARIWRAFSVEGTRLIAWALAISIGVSFAIGRLLQELLFGVPPLDPLTVAAAAAAFAAVWFGGIYLPARRATAVDPSRALRWE